MFPPSADEGNEMADQLQDDINTILRRFGDHYSDHPEDAETLESEPESEISETIHVYFVREPAFEETSDEQVVESTLSIPEPVKQAPQLKQRSSSSLARVTAGVGIALLLAAIAFQVLLAYLTPTVTITLVPAARHLTITAMITAKPGPPGAGHLQGRLLSPLTLTQTKTVPATGKGHQDAQYAMGTITFYNGLFSSQTVSSGTSLTGTDGIQVVIDQVAVIPAALATSPPTYGQVTVPAHVVEPGSQGNVSARDINQACCLPSVLAQNTIAFQGGQNARDFTYVTRADIDTVVTNLTAALSQSEHAALAVQISRSEALATPTCTPTVTADHRPGEEATAMNVTVSERCTAIAYNSAALQATATRLLTLKAQQQFGAHYSLIGTVQVSVLHATITNQRQEMASIATSVIGRLLYQFSPIELQQIKQRIAGKAPQQARHFLLNVPGVARATIEGIEANQRLPKDSTRIYITTLYMAFSS